MRRRFDELVERALLAMPRVAANPPADIAETARALNLMNESYLLDAFVASGHRVVCPDLVGFGKSDKPTDQGWYTYERHVDCVTRHLEQIDLEEVTVVVQDWGGPIGLRWAVENTDRVGRLVVMNTG